MKPNTNLPIALLLALATGCTDELRPTLSRADARPTRCAPARSAEALPARSATMRPSGGTSGEIIYTESLFRDFRFHCGGCHVDTNLGGFQLNSSTFAGRLEAGTELSTELFSRIESDDPDEYMPPAPIGLPWSERLTREGDPIVRLRGQLRAWIDAGSPRDYFTPDGSGSGDSPRPNAFALSESVGMGLTNIGNCVPDRVLATIGDGASSAEAETMRRLDAAFARATELPSRLEETDLVTFDSAELARHRVLAFAPAYPLWSDGSGKLRHVRVPIGSSIRYDETTHEFEIPPNTRFYKTFLRRVIDDQGRERFRKIETRIIVSRPDAVRDDGTAETRSLFGVYQWNDTEDEAVLVDASDAPLRNGEAFLDKVLLYETNEPEAARVRETTPGNAVFALEEAGLIRHYAIPGRARCVQCHMGSPNGSFVLGFTPIQLHRRPLGEGGVFEPSGDDELDQLARFIDYGVVTGMDPSRPRRLEDSEGDRRPRNDQELTAQGYMLGNCAHCHNPRGFPSVESPELRSVLDFWPSSVGGIFQFPLDRTSPRILRGVSQSIPIPYITPSLYDSNQDANTMKGVPYTYVSGSSAYAYVEAPWRSLIYRNVDAPFTYVDDFAIYPHMPMNTAGYDCRAPRIMGEWMSSIPAKLRDQPERFDDAPGLRQLYTNTDPQPFVEVRPNDFRYGEAFIAARERLERYRAGGRYGYCADTSDVVAPEVLHGTCYSYATCTAPEPARLPMTVDTASGPQTFWWSADIPARPHWAITDLTEPPGDWYPRRANWIDYLVPRSSVPPDEAPDEDPCPGDPDPDHSYRLCELGAPVQTVIERLAEIRISDVDGAIDEDLQRFFAIDPMPYGLWEQQPGCDFSSIPTETDFVSDDTFRWIRRRLADGIPDRPVYAASPGAVVFEQICSNCHGRQADSNGRLASNLAALTGGDTRVANLRDGLFGVNGGGTSNRDRVFGIGDSGTEFDWSVRYMLFMGLGGTTRRIPDQFTQLVGNTPVFGVARRGSYSFGGSPNMLDMARNFCHDVLPAYRETVNPDGTTSHAGRSVLFDLAFGSVSHYATGAKSNDTTDLFEANGDGEIWERICANQNPTPIRAVRFTSSGGGSYDFRVETTSFAWSLFDRTAPYPVAALVGDHRGSVVTGLAATNRAPWCLVEPSTPELLSALEARWTSVRGADPIPFCPSSLFVDSADRFDRDEIADWTLRGAMNAGIAVYLYLDAITRGVVSPAPPYNRCERIAP